MTSMIARLSASGMASLAAAGVAIAHPGHSHEGADHHMLEVPAPSAITAEGIAVLLGVALGLAAVYYVLGRPGSNDKNS